MKRTKIISLLLLLILPLAGVLVDGKTISTYLEFPPLTRYVQHAGFDWLVFVGMASFIFAVIFPFVLRIIFPQTKTNHTPIEKKKFPWWGWLGIVLGSITWLLAWSRFDWFTPFQVFTFSPLWFSYILVINALTYRRSGYCMLKHRTGYFVLLFLVSAFFWWFFEYLNRFVQNWYYVGIGDLNPLQYFLYATLPFSTVLPAVLGTYEFLKTFPRLYVGLSDFFKIKVKNAKFAAWTVLVISCFGLFGIGIWPDNLYPLLWVSPLLIITSIQAINGKKTIFSPVAWGNWERIILLALSALICGLFWEMWNFYSEAKWVYSVPFVNRFKIFEMPILGFAGYLPFGLECAVIADMAAEFSPKTIKGFNKKRLIASIIVIIFSTIIWLPCMHSLFSVKLNDYYTDRGISKQALFMANYHLDLWNNTKKRAREIAKMRRNNAEWDFMGRTFFVLSLANMALRKPEEEKKCLEIMDCIIWETLDLEKEKGVYYFLMDYAKKGSFIDQNKRSIFQDGEIALMLAARQLIKEKYDYKSRLRQRVESMIKVMRNSQNLCAESYPDECWMFCNSVAIAAIAISDVLEHTDHSDFISNWLKKVKEQLVHSETGLLVSSFTLDGKFLDGPEGSSIWMTAHCLQLVDPDFAEDQYRRAKKELAGSFFGFGYAREWPDSWKGKMDIDSGPIVPIFDISAGSSGLAFVGASSFKDRDYLKELLTSLNYGGFPLRKDGTLKYCASNQVGNAVILYSMVLGPLWDEVNRRRDNSRNNDDE